MIYMCHISGSFEDLLLKGGPTLYRGDQSREGQGLNQGKKIIEKQVPGRYSMWNIHDR
jgi:hypothetical protein